MGTGAASFFGGLAQGSQRAGERAQDFALALMHMKNRKAAEEARLEEARKRREQGARFDELSMLLKVTDFELGFIEDKLAMLQQEFSVAPEGEKRKSIAAEIKQLESQKKRILQNARDSIGKTAKENPTLNSIINEDSGVDPGFVDNKVGADNTDLGFLSDGGVSESTDPGFSVPRTARSLGKTRGEKDRFESEAIGSMAANRQAYEYGGRVDPETRKRQDEWWSGFKKDVSNFFSLPKASSGKTVYRTKDGKPVGGNTEDEIAHLFQNAPDEFKTPLYELMKRNMPGAQNEKSLSGQYVDIILEQRRRRLAGQ